MSSHQSGVSGDIKAKSASIFNTVFVSLKCVHVQILIDLILCAIFWFSGNLKKSKFGHFCLSVHHSVVFLRHKSVCVHVRILCAIFWFSGYWKKVGHFYLSAHQSVVSGDTHAGEIKAHNQRLLPKKLQKVVIYVIHHHHHLVG